MSIRAVPVAYRSMDNFKEARSLLYLALFAAPFYWIVVPFLVFNHIRENVLFGLLLLSLSMANFLHVLAWLNYNFVFGTDSVKLPGALGTRIQYSRIKKIARSNDYPLIVAVFFTADGRLLRTNRSKDEEILRWYAVRDEESAKILWSHFLERFENSATRVTENCISMRKEN